jgi:crotonobetainyl-CoA:carnitine CoA-transferase CaiB-like acyl-CoA transferase
MAFAVVAAVRVRDMHRGTGAEPRSEGSERRRRREPCGEGQLGFPNLEQGGRHIDFSMLEALLWTMPGALIAGQVTGVEARPAGNNDANHAPHGVFRCAGEDRWLAIAVTEDAEWHALCSAVPALRDLTALSEEQRRGARITIDARLAEWARNRDAIEAMEALQAAGVPASASYTTNDLFSDAHLWERGFYKPVQERDGTQRFLPSLPWLWGDGSLIEPRAAPALGQDTERVLREIAGLSEAEVAALRRAGAFGGPDS